MTTDQLYKGLESTLWTDREKKWAIREIEIRHNQKQRQAEEERTNIADLAKMTPEQARRAMELL